MSQQVLDPETLVRIQHLALVAKEASLGAISGIHPARRRGSSVEFAEHKEYAPGDDTRRIDWKAFGRLDRYYLKEFQEEANLRLYLVVDHSGSMGYGKPGQNKLDHARTLAAGLAHLALNQRDSVGLLTCGNGLRELLPPRTRSSHFEEILMRLIAAKPGGKAELAAALNEVAEIVRGPSLCVVVSDLLDTPVAGAAGDPISIMQHLTARGVEVAVLQVQHPDERDFPFESPAFFASMEDPRRVFVQPRVLRQAFIQAMAEFRERIAARLAMYRIDHQLAWSDQPSGDVLSSFLSQRMHLVRARR